MERFLTILEVSQKQAYIFSSNKLKDNITNSNAIEHVMSTSYFAQTAPKFFSKEKNFVYSGGGHTVLEFDKLKNAQEFTKKITYQIRKDYNGIEVFAATIQYEEITEDGMRKTPKDNLDKLIKTLERKKAIRRSAFHHGTFGVEQMDSGTLKPILVTSGIISNAYKNGHDTRTKDGPSQGYSYVSRFEDLGCDKYNSSFIAVVHIDGNAMGKRVKKVQDDFGDSNWEVFKEKMDDFSRQIDESFKKSYQEMEECVIKNMAGGRLNDLNLKDGNFPVRKIILAGDDVCFVSEGRIGLECAAIMLSKLKENGYAACAGVAIVHQKYPFYCAYEIAEKLCSNAKKLGVSLDKESGWEVSAIDWHIEYGELENSLEEIRGRYLSNDGGHLELRPYIVCAPDKLIKEEPFRQYQNFKTLVKHIQSDDIAYAKGKIKQLRQTLKHGELQTKYFLAFNKIEDIMIDGYYGIYEEIDYNRITIGEGRPMERKIFIKTHNSERHSYLFDAIEALDTFLSLEEL